MEYYRIACIVRPHGVQGNVKLEPLTDNVNRFRGLQEAYLETDGKRTLVKLNGIGINPDAVTLHIEGVDTREEAEKLRGAYLCVDKTHAVRLPPDTYFVADLIGCTVTDTAGTAYGRITDVLETGANDVYVVEGGRSMMLPALKKVLHTVDVEQKRIVLNSEVVGEVALFAD